MAEGERTIQGVGHHPPSRRGIQAMSAVTAEQARQVSVLPELEDWVQTQDWVS